MDRTVFFKVFKEGFCLTTEENYSKAESYAKSNRCDTINRVEESYGNEVSEKVVWRA